MLDIDKKMIILADDKTSMNFLESLLESKGYTNIGRSFPDRKILAISIFDILKERYAIRYGEADGPNPISATDFAKQYGNRKRSKLITLLIGDKFG